MQLWNEYEQITNETAVYPQSSLQAKVTYVALGLAGETGEVVDVIKKQVRREGDFTDEVFKTAVALELGDLLWYVARLCVELDMSFEEVLMLNVSKLRARKVNGQLKDR